MRDKRFERKYTNVSSKAGHYSDSGNLGNGRKHTADYVRKSKGIFGRRTLIRQSKCGGRKVNCGLSCWSPLDSRYGTADFLRFDRCSAPQRGENERASENRGTVQHFRQRHTAVRPRLKYSWERSHRSCTYFGPLTEDRGLFLMMDESWRQLVPQNWVIPQCLNAAIESHSPGLHIYKAGKAKCGRLASEGHISARCCAGYTAIPEALTDLMTVGFRWVLSGFL
jgi:hypothetical protein